jgi:8-oxo-dGTP diphosphatase
MISRPILFVVAVAMLDSQGRLLLAQRPAGKSLAGLWEFPGGKVEPGEAPEAALERELMEEIGVLPAALEYLGFAVHGYERFDLLMPLFGCRHWQGEPTGHEGQALAWVAPADLDRWPMPPADLPLLPLIRRWAVG